MLMMMLIYYWLPYLRSEDASISEELERLFQLTQETEQEVNRLHLKQENFVIVRVYFM